MILRRLLVGSLLAASALAATALTLDRLFPPDLSRYRERSTEIVDANDRLLRSFTTSDGKWRLRTTVDDVDPTYLAMLKAYEDRRFDVHWGIDPFAVFRAAEQWIGRGRIVSGASTLSMQAARLLDPGLQPAAKRSLLTKAVQSARALQLEWRYSKREILAIYLTLAILAARHFRSAAARRRSCSAERHRMAPPATRRMAIRACPNSDDDFMALHSGERLERWNREP